MKILQIANGYLGSRLYRNLFAALKDAGVENIVYVPVGNRAPLPEAEEGVIVSRCFSQLDRLTFFAKQRKLLRDMEARVELSSVDMVHAHTVFSGGYAAYQLHRRYGLPYIVAVRNTDKNVFFRRMVHLRKTGVEIMRHAERVIFLSPAYQESVLAEYVPEKYREELRRKSLVIPNGIAPLFLSGEAAPRTLGEGPVRLIYVGEVRCNKNLEETIQAARLLREKGLEVTLTVVGAIVDDAYRPMMETAGFIDYHDRCPQEEVLGYLRNADIFVMPSHSETFGLVYAEAMSQGLPVLYTRGQGFDGHFPDGTVGYAVSDSDPAQLADRLERVISGYAELSANCVRLARRFDWNRIAGQYQEIYQRREKPGGTPSGAFV